MAHVSVSNGLPRRTRQSSMIFIDNSARCAPYPRTHGKRMVRDLGTIDSKRIIGKHQVQTIAKQSLATATMSEYADKAELIKSKIQEREEFVRESWVKAMEARLVRDELVKCHRLEGVNHLENCRWLSDKYISMLKENKNDHSNYTASIDV
ncbi:hypothetical protein EDB19DRAFT_1830674 [Suillus lakei]|nr:hypothetical protein EDB19DRAFT_1830674 [Suillus lakei]